MRNNFPISSQELNDLIINAYGDLCYLLGYNHDGVVLTGVFDNLEDSGLAYMGDSSGIPHIGTSDSKYQLGLEQEFTSSQVIEFLKFDYVYRKILGYI